MHIAVLFVVTKDLFHRQGRLKRVARRTWGTTVVFGAFGAFVIVDLTITSATTPWALVKNGARLLSADEEGRRFWTALLHWLQLPVFCYGAAFCASTYYTFHPLMMMLYNAPAVMLDAIGYNLRVICSVKHPLHGGKSLVGPSC